MNRLVEIRSYQLKPGCTEALHHRFTTRALPLLRAAGMDVVAGGPSAHEADTYFLVRAYADLVDRDTQQAAFYGSDVWRSGPRAAILECIETFLDTVMWLSPAAIEDLRCNNPLP